MVLIKCVEIINVCESFLVERVGNINCLAADLVPRVLAVAVNVTDVLAGDALPVGAAVGPGLGDRQVQVEQTGPATAGISELPAMDPDGEVGRLAGEGSY